MNFLAMLIDTNFISQKRFGSEIDVTEDDINLVESQPNRNNEEKRSANMWRTFSNIVDRIIFAAVTVIYMIMFISLLPEKFLDASQKTNSVEIVGY